MADLDSPDEDKRVRDSIAYARRVLEPRIPRERVWPTLAAAAFFAICAMGFATAAVLAPPVALTAPTKPAAL